MELEKESLVGEKKKPRIMKLYLQRESFYKRVAPPRRYNKQRKIEISGAVKTFDF